MLLGRCSHLLAWPPGIILQSKQCVCVSLCAVSVCVCALANECVCVDKPVEQQDALCPVQIETQLSAHSGALIPSPPPSSASLAVSPAPRSSHNKVVNFSYLAARSKLPPVSPVLSCAFLLPLLLFRFLFFFLTASLSVNSLLSADAQRVTIPALQQPRGRKRRIQGIAAAGGGEKGRGGGGKSKRGRRESVGTE